MSKIICDICGTVYPDTAESCPICGYTRNLGMEELDEDLLADMPSRGKGGRFSSSNVKKKNKEIFDYDEVNADELDEDEEDEEPYDDEESYEEEPKSNTFLVVVLVIIITLLLVATGFLFFRYFLPNALSGDEAAPATEVYEETVSEETTVPTVPCTDIVLMSGGKVELYNEGYFHLLHVKVVPEDTTDTLTFTSADESVAVVNEDGRITAVGEGETTILISCGEKQIKCPVIVIYEEETEPSVETIEETGDSGEEATEALAVEETTLKDVELKLKDKDKSLDVGYSFQLKLDCDLDPSEVEWSVEHSYIATVDENGNVKAKASGTTAVHVKYGDQEVKCIIRCR